MKSYEELQSASINCPIQNGVADVDPDVDAIYRLAFDMPVRFEKADRKVALGKGSWCPFNSQNTTFFKEIFEIMYFPTYCPFRMADIWRSLVCQRIMWENDWKLMFHGPTVWQDRNEHDIMLDFKDEILGYQHNGEIVKHLEDLDIKSGTQNLGDNLRKCYNVYVKLGLMERKELQLVDAWLEDVNKIL